MIVAEKFCWSTMLALTLIWGCAKEPKGPIAENKPKSYVDSEGKNPTMVRDTVNNPYPYMLMADGQQTLNDRCPVRHVPMNLRMPALFVNGRPIGFC